jgi:hypothetical protein
VPCLALRSHPAPASARHAPAPCSSRTQATISSHRPVPTSVDRCPNARRLAGNACRITGISLPTLPGCLSGINPQLDPRSAHGGERIGS